MVQYEPGGNCARTRRKRAKRAAVTSTYPLREHFKAPRQLIRHNAGCRFRSKLPFFRSLLGSITAKVLHDICCPVLTSAHRPDPAFSQMNGYRSVLCAIEMNREANEILDAAAFLAQSYDAQLCLVHMESISSRQGAEQDIANSRLLLEQALSRYSSAGLRPNLRILDASVPEGIRRTAIEEGADLLVVGRGHQRDRLSRLWSPLYTIILESPCLVLSV